MSYQVQSGDLSPFTEVVPESAKLGGLSKSSILTQRRRVRIVPQTSPSATPSSQVQFLIADQGGLLDPASIVLNYTITSTGTGLVAPDDGHVFSTVQVLLNGQLVDNIQNAMRVTNVEMKLGGSKSYYQTAGSLQGFELLNNDLNPAVPTATAADLLAAYGQYGCITSNLAGIDARVKRPAAAVFNNQSGETRSIPLGLMTGFGRCSTYIPIALLGEVGLVLQTGSNADVMFQYSATQDATYALANLSLEYDVVIPASPYMELLQKIASDPADSGIHIPYESTIVGSGGVISQSATLQESTIITSRATNNLVKASTVLVPQAGVSSLGFPSQSCFSHAGTFSYQYRIGSQVYPQVACQGDASMFNTSLAAYGSPMNENGSAVNRSLWGNSTNPATAGTAAVFETAQVATGGTVKFAYADSFIPSYGFRTVKGKTAPLDIDGVSLAGASGSQLITALVSAPFTSYSPFVVMTALRILSAKGGVSSVIGA